MTIPVNKYVEIDTQYKSTKTLNKSLSLRIFTENEDMPSGTTVELNSLEAVGVLFGIASIEYRKSARYFNFATLQGKSPSIISFYNSSKVATEPFSLGSQVANDYITEIKKVTAGSITIDFGTEQVLTGLDFSTVTDTDSIIAIISATMTGVTLTFDDINRRFKFSSDTAGVGVANVITGTSGLILAMGLSTQLLSQGSNLDTISGILNKSEANNDNFSSFTVLNATSDEDIEACSVFANGSNSLYMYSVTVTTDSPTFLDNIKDGGGTVVNYDDINEDTEIIPCAVLASTDFTANNGVERYMFVNVSGMPAVVTDDKYISLDSKNINYYGQTSKSGEKYSFYQDGKITGDAKFIEIYSGELFVKDDLQGKLLQLLLNTRRFPASQIGESLVRNTIIASASGYLISGIIEPRELTNQEEIELEANVGKTIVEQVKSNGYGVQTSVNGTTIEYLFVYLTFVGVRKIKGTHIVQGV